MHFLVSEQYIDSIMHGATVKVESVCQFTQDWQQYTYTRFYRKQKLTYFYLGHSSVWPIPVATQSKGVGLQPLSSWDCGFESRREGMDVCCECCVLSGRGLCDGLITSPEESY